MDTPAHSLSTSGLFFLGKSSGKSRVQTFEGMLKFKNRKLINKYSKSIKPLDGSILSVGGEANDV
jgi:hypothetical protein